MVLSIFTLISSASYHNHISSFLGACVNCAFKDLKLTIIIVTLPYVCMAALIFKVSSRRFSFTLSSGVSEERGLKASVNQRAILDQKSYPQNPRSKVGIYESSIVSFPPGYTLWKFNSVHDQSLKIISEGVWRNMGE